MNKKSDTAWAKTLAKGMGIPLKRCKNELKIILPLGGYLCIWIGEGCSPRQRKQNIHTFEQMLVAIDAWKGRSYKKKKEGVK